MNLLQELISLLTAKQRNQAGVLLLIMILGSIAEVASIGLVIPALALLLDNNLGVRYPRLNPVLEALNYPSQTELLVYGMGVFFSIYLVKSIFLAFLAWRQSVFVFGVRADISQRLFSEYLRRPWSFHLNRNSADLLNMLANETNVVTASALQPGLIFISEALVLLGLCVLLTVAEGFDVLAVISVLGVAVMTFHSLTSRYVVELGKSRFNHESLRIQHAQQGLGSVKDLKLLGREEGFLSQYLIHNLGSTRSVKWQNFLQQLPRLWLEVLAVGGLAAVVIMLVEQGKSSQDTLITIGLLAMAAFRLIPSANRIIGAIQSLRYSRPAVTAICAELGQIGDIHLPTETKPFVFRHSISLVGISYRYPKANNDSLSNISLMIPRGSSVGFIGESGAGKSTLVDIVLGLLSPDAGSVRVDDTEIRNNLRGWQKLVGYVPQTIYLTDDTLRRNIAFGLSESEIDNAAVDRAIRAAKLDEFVKALPEGLHTMVGERGVRLSGGQRQRVGIARALYRDPEVLVLDEATSALDSSTEAEVMDAVDLLVGNKTVIVVAHRMSTVANCTRLFHLKNGRVVDQGTPDQVIATLNFRSTGATNI